MTVLSNLPGDVLLETFKHLLLPDPISLLMTCTTLYRFSNHRSFWISVLATARAERPLSCPSYDNLSEYDLESLKCIAFRWLRLDDNWKRPFPRILGQVRSMSCGGPVDIVSIVPGTDIVILRLLELDRLLCWDIASGIPFNLDSLECIGRIFSASEPYEKRGEYAVTLLTVQDDNYWNPHLHVISIDHKDRKALTFRRSFTQDFKFSPRFYYEGAFLHEDVAGFVGFKLDDNQCVIHAFNLTTRESLRIKTRIDRPLGSFDQTACFGFEGHVYVTVVKDSYLHICHCPRDVLPYSRLTASHSVTDLPLEGPFVWGASYESYDPLCITLPSTPVYGVNAVFVRNVSPPAVGPDDANTIIKFSPNRLTGDLQSPLRFHDAIGLTATLPGRLDYQRLSLVWLDHSGSNLLALMDHSRALSLKLVRYHRHQASVSVHELLVPSSIDLHTVHGLAIDETCGAIILVITTGVIHYIPYA